MKRVSLLIIKCLILTGVLGCERVSMGWCHLPLSAKSLAFLRLSANFFQLRLTKKLNIN